MFWIEFQRWFCYRLSVISQLTFYAWNQLCVWSWWWHELQIFFCSLLLVILPVSIYTFQIVAGFHHMLISCAVFTCACCTTTPHYSESKALYVVLPGQVYGEKAFALLVYCYHHPKHKINKRKQTNKLLHKPLGNTCLQRPSTLGGNSLSGTPLRIISGTALFLQS